MGKTYIISYPRSGNTAFRYLIELLTGMPTNGLCHQRGLNIEKDPLQMPLLHKGTIKEYDLYGEKEFITFKQHDFDGVNTDDFVFFIARDPIEAIIRHNEASRGLELEKMYQYIDDWIQLYKQYEAFPGNKMLIKYSELIKLVPEGRKYYPNPQSDSPDFHKNKLNEGEIKALKAYIKKCLPTINY